MQQKGSLTEALIRILPFFRRRRCPAFDICNVGVAIRTKPLTIWRFCGGIRNLAAIGTDFIGHCAPPSTVLSKYSTQGKYILFHLWKKLLQVNFLTLCLQADRDSYCFFMVTSPARQRTKPLSVSKSSAPCESISTARPQITCPAKRTATSCPRVTV